MTGTGRRSAVSGVSASRLNAGAADDPVLLLANSEGCLMTSSARPRINAAFDVHRKDTAMTPAPTSGELCSVPAAGLSNPVKPIAIHLGDGGLAWCQWGVIEHSCPRPDRGNVGPLMIVTAEYLRELLDNGPQEWPRGTHSVTTDGRRVFAHHDYHGQRWTWELFPAYFTDNLGPPVCIGRWPD